MPRRLNIPDRNGDFNNKYFCSNNSLHVIDSEFAEQNNYFCPLCDYGVGILQRLSKKQPESFPKDDNNQVPNLKRRKRIPIEKKPYKEVEDKTDEIAYVNFLIKETELVNTAIEKVPMILDNLNKKGWDGLDLENYSSFTTICELDIKGVLEYELADLNIELDDFIKANDLIDNFQINEEALMIHKAVKSNSGYIFSPGGSFEKGLKSIGKIYRNEFIKMMNSLYIPKYFGMYNYTFRGGSGWFFSDSFLGRNPRRNY